MDFDNLPQKSQYKFKEVTSLTGVKPYVLRFWESEFSHINPMTDENGQKIYSQNDLSNIKKIKDLLFEQKLSIPKAKAMLDESMDDQLSHDTDNEQLAEVVVEAKIEKLAEIAASPEVYTGVEIREAIGNMIRSHNGSLDQYKEELARELEAQKKLIKQKQFDDQDLLCIVKAKKKLSSVLSKIDSIIEARGW